MYDELLGRVRVAVEPADVIEEMFVAEVVWHVWDIQRWQRLKSQLLRARTNDQLRAFLSEALDSDDYREEFEQSLAEILEEYLPKRQAEKLAERGARGDEAAIDEINQLRKKQPPMSGAPHEPTDDGPTPHQILDHVKDDHVEQLARDFARSHPTSVKRVDKLLASHGLTLDNLLLDGLIVDGYLAKVERIEQLISLAEARRNNSLHEIDRHRETLGNNLRRTFKNIEDEEPRVIENGKASRHE